MVRSIEGRLEVGSRAAVLYRGLLRRFENNREILPVVNEVSAATGETAYFAGVCSEGVMVQEVVEGKQAVRVAGLYVGYMGSEHRRASGKAVLAYLDEEARRRMLSYSTAMCSEDVTKSVVAGIERECGLIRERGWAIDEEEFAPKVCCVSAPVFGISGSVVGSLAVSAPADRFQAARGEIIAAVCDSARRASRLLGYSKECLS